MRYPGSSALARGSLVETTLAMLLYPKRYFGGGPKRGVSGLLLVLALVVVGCGDGGGPKCKYHDEFGRELCNSLVGKPKDVATYRDLAPPPRHPRIR